MYVIQSLSFVNHSYFIIHTHVASRILQYDTGAGTFHETFTSQFPFTDVACEYSRFSLLSGMYFIHMCIVLKYIVILLLLCCS